MYITKYIGKSLPGEELEKILIKAAEEVGLKATPINRYSTEYGEQVYLSTTIRLSRKILPFAEISGIKRGRERLWFEVKTGFDAFIPYFGFGSKKQVEGYLNVVYRYINQSQKTSN
nr:hypothetical protein [Candidatus Woesearchaeota archaeon]